MVKNILSLARGLVRPLVTFLFAGGALWGFVVGAIPAEAFLALVGPVIGFWFSERTTKKQDTTSEGT